MWFSPVSVSDPVSEPVSLSDAQDHCRAPETEFAAKLSALISAGRSYAEAYCNTRFAQTTIVVECEGFEDMARLPEAPLASVSSIEYIDVDGVSQTLPGSVYVENKNGLEPSIDLAMGQSWPSVYPGSRITLTAEFGGSCPASVRSAILFWVAQGFLHREDREQPKWTVVDSLLANSRRGAW